MMQLLDIRSMKVRRFFVGLPLSVRQLHKEPAAGYLPASGAAPPVWRHGAGSTASEDPPDLACDAGLVLPSVSFNIPPDIGSHAAHALYPPQVVQPYGRSSFWQGVALLIS